MTRSEMMFTRTRTIIETEYGSAVVSGAGYVYNVLVHYDHRGEGHGTALMWLVIEHAQKENLTLRLQCRPGLAHWYETFGFVRDYGMDNMMLSSGLDPAERKLVDMIRSVE